MSESLDDKFLRLAQASGIFERDPQGPPALEDQYPREEHPELKPAASVKDHSTNLLLIFHFMKAKTKGNDNNNRQGASSDAKLARTKAYKSAARSWILTHKPARKGTAKALELWTRALLVEAIDHVYQNLKVLELSTKEEKRLFESDRPHSGTASLSMESRGKVKLTSICNSILADSPLEPVVREKNKVTTWCLQDGNYVTAPLTGTKGVNFN